MTVVCHGVRQGILRSMAAVMLVLSASAALADPQYVQINGRRPIAINSAGTVTGRGSYNENLGFVMTRDGAITDFTVKRSITTTPAGINDSGYIAGTYRDGRDFLYHGFLRVPDGTITKIDAMGHYGRDNQGTVVTGIDQDGYITGYVQKSRHHEFGFIRSPDGTITRTECGSRTATSLGINADQTVIGICYGFGGYLRAADGTVTMLGDLDPVALNDAGSIAGYKESNPRSGFLRTPDGTVAIFDPSGGVGYGTQTAAINSSEAIVGYYNDAQSLNHGFLRTSDGTITTFDPPGSSGTFPAAINASGVIAGTYFAADGNVDGFVRIP